MYEAKSRFDDGSKKHEKGTSVYEIGEEYKGPNAEKLLAKGLVKLVSPPLAPVPKAEEVEAPKKKRGRPPKEKSE